MIKFFLPMFMLLFTCAVAQVNNNRLSISPQKPVAGKSLILIYDKDYSNLDNTKPVKAALYQFINYHWQTDTVSLAQRTNEFKTSIDVRPGTSFIAVKFYQGDLKSPDKFDNNNELGYSIPISDKKGRNLPGGALAQALLMLPGYSGGIPGYFKSDKVKMSADSLNRLLGQELQQKNSSPVKYVHAYLALQRHIQGNEFKTNAPVLLERLLALSELSEQDMSEIYRVYQYELRDKARADQLKNKLINKFPTGELARFDAYQQVVSNGGKNEQLIARCEHFLNTFPIAEFRRNPSQQGYIYYEVYRLLATAYFDSGNYSALLRLRSDWDFKTENEVYRWNLERAYMLKSVPIFTLQPLADSIFNDLLKKEQDNSYRTDFDQSEQAQANVSKQLTLRIANQIEIHYASGDYQGAERYYKLFKTADLYASADLNAIHLDLLDKTGQSQLIGHLLEESVKANSVTPDMFIRLKQIYTKMNGSEVGYEQYLASLKSSNEIADLKEYVQAHMMTRDMMPFALEDLNGQLVRSSDWDGKIVVLDFWATWCRPCIMAFPGMQLTVDKYAKDPLVDFYFIGTSQSGDYKKKVKDFIKREGWRFKVLHDGINPKSGEQNAVFSTIAPMFNSSGIPRKIILKDGVIRYSTEGYSGSPSKLVDELSYAIDKLKAEK
ncbi:TlpA disulfide reductase family protein [Mucilaginibacter sp. PAMB04274]|uniref:TlpA disulfide reductase family protein n=1 Tax=Mucilaginibacter sp. PAMB04274 TaxID=3138568 RepID=UPI0031F5FBE5